MFQGLRISWLRLECWKTKSNEFTWAQKTFIPPHISIFLHTHTACYPKEHHCIQNHSKETGWKHYCKLALMQIHKYKYCIGCSVQPLPWARSACFPHLFLSSKRTLLKLWLTSGHNTNPFSESGVVFWPTITAVTLWLSPFLRFYNHHTSVKWMAPYM